MAQTEASPGLDPDSGSSSRGFLLAVIAVVVLGLAAVAYVATTRSDDGGSAGQATADGTDGTDGTATDGTSVGDGLEAAAVQITGDRLAQLPEGLSVTDAATDPLFGTVAPTLTGSGFDGSAVTIEGDGSPKVIYFVAHWCPHCQDEVPLVQQLIDDGRKPDELAIYVVSTALNPGQGNYPPSEWLADEGLEAIIVRDDADSTAFVQFGGSGFPYAVYLDGENRIVARSTGSLDDTTTLQLWELAAEAG